MVNENLGEELYIKFNTVLDDLAGLPIGVPLGWLYIWDIIRDYHEDLVEHPGDTSYGEYELVPGVDLKKLWDTLWENPAGGFDWNTEDVVDWMVLHGLIQFVEYEDDEEEEE
jgi:hypothetical protein